MVNVGRTLYGLVSSSPFCVTPIADSSSQYDAIRAYLKELDITDNVWIGLSKNAEKPNFTWTNNLQSLSGEGHWQESIPLSKNSLCVAMDPANDFLWKALTCGEPELASFICEMPIPSWAMGPKGCLLTELPSLTVLYIPEQSSLELTSDCGLDGTKRIACKGNADREEILKQLTCIISNEYFEDKSTKSLVTVSTVSYTQSDSKTTKLWSSNTIEVDYGMPTRHRRETEDTLSASSTESTGKSTPALEAFTATNYDTEITTNSISDRTTLDPVIFNTSLVHILTTSSVISTKLTSTKLPSITSTNSSIAKIPYSTTTENVTPIIETAQSFTTLDEISNAETKSVKSTPIPAEKDIVMEYPNAISQGQLFSIIENGTMFDIIELNETSDSKPPQSEEVVTPEIKTSKPSIKLQQLDDKNTKNPLDPKTKPFSKKDIYKNADPKKKNMQKTTEEKEALSTKKTNIESLKNTTKEKREEKYIMRDIKEKDDKTADVIMREIEKAAINMFNAEDTQKEIHVTTEIIEDKEDKLEESNSKEELDLNKQVEILPIKQLADEITVIKHDTDIETNLPNGEPEDIETTPTQVNENKESMEEMDLNKEIELFPVIHDKSLHLNRTFRKELPMLADEPSFDETKEVGDNKLELMDIDEFVPRPLENETKIDPNIDLLNKNLSKNNDSEIISYIDKDVLKKQLLPKLLQGEQNKTVVKKENPVDKENHTEQPKSIKGDETKKSTKLTTEEMSESQENDDHPRPNRQRQLTRPHGRPFYPNFFSRVLG